MSKYRIGCDIGGTFTDFILFNDETKDMFVHKLLSSPGEFEKSVIQGAKDLIDKYEINTEGVQFFCHSSTVALNTLVERKGGNTALITTKGFRDVLEIGRATRVHEYDLFQTKTPPLVPRNLRFEVNERMNYEGEMIEPLDEEEILRVARHLRKEGIQTVSVVFLHSYANGAHEKRAKELILSVMPEAIVSLSSEINPIYREFERTSSTVVNTYVAPKVIDYLSKLEKELKKLGFLCELHITQSSGGLMSSQFAKERTINMLMAGPAAGVTAAAYIARLSGEDKIIALDTGGTTQLISLVENNSITPIIDAEIAGYPVRVPVVDVRAIGAGGGSIARIDSGGKLTVGPDSAGARPGPVCYGVGGTEPTVTDADVVLGYLNPDFFLGGGIKLDKKKAEEAIFGKIAKPLGLNLYEAASGIIEVINSERIGSIRKLLIEEGHDPRDFSIVAFGGAGPVHAAEIAKELEVKSVIVPKHPGLLSPIGSLSAELRRDHIQTLNLNLDQLKIEGLKKISDENRERLMNELKDEGVRAEEITFNMQADIKYDGQLNELIVDVETLDKEEIKENFFKEHERLFGYYTEDEEVMMTNLRFIAKYQFPEVSLKEVEEIDQNTARARKEDRYVYFKEYAKLIDCPVYDRNLLNRNNVIYGPAIVEEYDSTTVIYPKQKAVVDLYGNLIISSIRNTGENAMTEEAEALY